MDRRSTKDQLYLIDPEGIVLAGKCGQDYTGRPWFDLTCRPGVPSDLVVCMLLAYACEMLEPPLRVKALVLMEILVQRFEAQQDADVPW